MTTRRLRRTAVPAALLALLAAGCSADEPRPTQRVVVCWGTQDPRPADGAVTFSFRQHGEEVASASGPVDLAFAATVPAGEVTTVLADGEPFGEIGVEADVADVAVDEDGATPGYYALTRPGCPDPATLGEAPAAG
ncbi:hypothetical protein [Kineococcus sp. SYSU DK001]|uniref:hypothetical protein n=1 Tax=Kineococcus sp. SYSU DK001 TaxID=3383122 RepID=UPI003D7C52BD